MTVAVATATQVRRTRAIILIKALECVWSNHITHHEEQCAVAATVTSSSSTTTQQQKQQQHQDEWAD